jgi:hypothetical protein
MPLDSKSEPSSPLELPKDPVKLLQAAMDIAETCRVSSGIRAAYCRQLDAMIETGQQDGTRSIINLMYGVVDRLSSHLFSPTGLRFMVDFENHYPKEWQERARVAARTLTRNWSRNNTDMTFGAGVFEALKYGASIMKQWTQEDGPEHIPTYHKKLVKPWQFGVFREDVSDLDSQPAMCETVMLTMPEVWRRIYRFDDAEKLFKRIREHAQRGVAGDEYNSFFHQVLSTSTLSTGNTGMTRPVPGGIVQLNNDPSYAILGPEIAAELVRMHEIWVWGETDYKMIQIIEPDILLSRYRLTNGLIPGDSGSGVHPYTKIQPNERDDYFWGRPEISDLIEPQGWLSTTANDIKRLLGLQVDKILGFTGIDGLTDETFDQYRGTGFYSVPQGASISDLTPKFPAEVIPMLDKMMGLIERIAGFDNILSGGGEPGVRAGVHADTLMKTAAPRLRDRSLLVERQAAEAADLTLTLMAAKDQRKYWTNGDSIEKMEETGFHLKDIPDDRQVSVDSHSSSPIFADDHQNLIGFGIKAGFLDGEDAINELPFPNKDLLIQRFKERNAAKAAQLAQLQKSDPEAYAKLLSHSGHK